MISHSAPASSAMATVMAEDCWTVGDAAVWWRLGRATESRAGALAWVEDLVRRETPWPWRGITRADARAKPRLVGETDLDFSVSHRGDVILVAVARGVRIGADVETSPFDAFDSAALRRRMLAPAERHLDDPGTALDRVALARVWTAKEALVKATGTGLSRDFRTFRVPTPPPSPAQDALAAVGCLCALAEAQHSQFLPLDLPA